MANPAKKSESSNYYRILGTNSNVSQDLIKKRYLEKVRAFPPEEEPQEFKRIRRAYDTLKDPLKRSEYDLETKYGGKVGRLFERANLMKDFAPDQALQLIEEALELASDNLLLLTFKAEIELENDNLQKFYQIFSDLEEKAPESKKMIFIAKKISFLVDNNRIKQAGKHIVKFKKKYPESQFEYKNLYLHYYLQAGEKKSLWSLLMKIIPAEKEQGIDHLDEFIELISVVANIDDQEKVNWTKKRVFNYLDSLSENDLQIAEEILEDSFYNFQVTNHFDGQYLFMEILLYIDPENEARQDVFENLKTQQEIFQEIKRMAENPDFFPLVKEKALELYFEEFMPEHNMEDCYRLDLDFQERRLMENADFAFIEALDEMEKDYPYIYNYFSDHWELLYDEHYHLLNSRDRKIIGSQIKTGKGTGYQEDDEGTIIKTEKVGRNDPCPCGSGKKYKKCCL